MNFLKIAIQKLVQLAKRIMTKSNPIVFENLIKDYNKYDLLKAISSFQLLPLNHGKNLWFELLTREILLKSEYREKEIPYEELSEFFQNNFEEYYMEDPMSSFFTENVIFFGGDYIVFPGINENGTRILNSYLEAIFLTDNELSEEFKKKVRDGIQLILLLSNSIAERAGLRRYLYEEDQEDIIRVPEKEKYQHLKESVLFTKNEIDQYANDYQFEFDTIKYFITDEKDDNLTEEDPLENPVAIKPIIQEGHSYILVNVGAIVNCLIEFIKIIATELNCHKELMDCYYSHGWMQIKSYLNDIHWQETDIKLPEVEGVLLASEGVFRFDNDKLAYVCMVKSLAGDEDDQPITSIKDRNLEVIQYLESLNGDIKYKYLTLFIPGEHGGEMLFSFDKPKEGNEAIAFSYSDFEALVYSDNLDALELWKFAKVYRITRERTKFMAFGSLLDAFAIYKVNDGSLLHSDKAIPDTLHLAIGGGDELRRDILRKRDEHSVLKFSTQGAVHSPVIRLRDYGPIYIEKHPIGGHIILLEEFNSPIWIINRQVNSESMKEAVNPFLEAVAFWIFKMRDQLKAYFEKLADIPIQIELVIDDNFFLTESIEIIEIEEGAITIPTEIKGRTVILSIPYNLIHLLMLPNNFGEKVLMKAVLNGLNQLLQSLDLDANMKEDFIVALTNSTLVPENAKMMLFFDTSNNLLIDNRWLLPYRRVQESEVSLILDFLVSKIDRKEAIPERIESKSEKNKLCNQIVSALVEEVTRKLKDYNSEDLLKWLIKYHERTIQKKEYREIHIPAKIACFSDFETEVNKMLKEEGDLVSTTLALRCLIEFIVAKPNSGNKWPNVDDIDELIALMDQIIQWGVLSDTINFNFDDPEMGLLPSGRIGTEKTFGKEIISGFAKSKIEDTVANFEDAFEGAFLKPKDSEKAEEVNEIEIATFDEWGIPLSKLLWIHGELAKYAIENGDSIGTLLLGDLQKVLKKRIPELSEDELEAGINLLTLKSREVITKSPKGYSKEDIYPWIYNRSLSYLRKPLLLIEKGEGDKIIIWGFRHILSAAENLQYLIFSGRYKVQKSESMESVLSKINEEKGKRFRDKVTSWLKENTDLEVVDHEVTINPKGHLIADKDYGDIDVLCTDKKQKKLYSIECKDTVGARIIHEMKTELDKYLGRSDGINKVQRHVNRDIWIKDNIDQLSKYVEYPKLYEVVSFILTSEEIPLYYIAKSKIPLPVISFGKMKRMGIDASLNS
ncbi:MAG: hypothetical protein RH860_11545 [Cytophagales bacterium]